MGQINLVSAGIFEHITHVQVTSICGAIRYNHHGQILKCIIHILCVRSFYCKNDWITLTRV